MPNDLWVVETTDDYKLAQNQVQLSELHGFVGVVGLNPKNHKKTQEYHPCKLTGRHGKSTILMVFTRKDGIFMGYVSLPEGITPVK